jgi:hypothetical protein
MKLRMSSVAVAALASGLLLASSHFQGVHADDRHEKGCINKTLKGTYGFYRTGTTATGPLVAIGLIFHDGMGNGTVTQNISRNGVLTLDSESSFTYEVAPDCTGKGFLDTGVEFVRFVIVDGGREFNFFSETSGNAIYGVAKRVDGTDNDHGR